MIAARSVTLGAVARAVVPAPNDDEAGGRTADELAKTGSPSSVELAGALALLVAGATLIGLRRARR